MNTIAIKYIYNSEKSAELSAHRPAHRTFLKSLFEAGKLLASGPLGENEALIILRAENIATALEMLTADPLYQENIILTREAKIWQPVIGPWENN